MDSKKESSGYSKESKLQDMDEKTQMEERRRFWAKMSPEVLTDVVAPLIIEEHLAERERERERER